MDDPGNLLYQIARFIFAGSLLLFLFLIVRITLRELQQDSDLDEEEFRAIRPYRLVLLDSPADELAGVQSFTGYGRAAIGRSPTCDVHIEDVSISAEHALIGPGPHGWLLTDLNSTNGTYVGGSRVDGAIDLVDGDVVQLGRVRLRFLC